MTGPSRRRRTLPFAAAALASSLAVVVAMLGVTPPAARATTFPGSVYSNVTAFDTCDGTPDTISRSLETLAQAGLTYLGYTSTAYITTGFTRGRVLGRAATDQAIYVHSHGDQYYDPYPTQVQGFREDGGDCSEAIVYATDVAAVRPASVHVVIM